MCNWSFQPARHLISTTLKDKRKFSFFHTKEFVTLHLRNLKGNYLVHFFYPIFQQELQKCHVGYSDII